MSGIIFLGTNNLKGIVEFYTRKVGMSIWLEQAECTILKHGNLLLGFCERKKPDIEGVFTFFYDSRSDVDGMYNELEQRAESPPKVNDRYKIYHFYFQDPEGRRCEIQKFLHELPPV